MILPKKSKTPNTKPKKPCGAGVGAGAATGDLVGAGTGARDLVGAILGAMLAVGAPPATKHHGARSRERRGWQRQA